jgi:hypothetical protein
MAAEYEDGGEVAKRVFRITMFGSALFVSAVFIFILPYA